MMNFLKMPTSFDPLDDRCFSARLDALHQMIQRIDGLDGVGRIAVSHYVPGADELRSFAASDHDLDPPASYAVRLGDIPSLKFLADKNKFRIIDDLPRRFFGRKSPHLALEPETYRSSLALPVKNAGRLYGIVFFNSSIAGYFRPDLINRLMPSMLLIREMFIAEIDALNALQAAVQTVKDIGNLRDFESAGHLRRVAAFSRLIAQRMAAVNGLNDEWIDRLEQFAPLHDVGKIGISEQILMKRGGLDDYETAVMQSHVHMGLDLVKTLLDNFALDHHPFAKMLCNIVAHHHETLDGQGYPASLKGRQISLEGRIVAAADIFDALINRQPFRTAWPVDVALSYLHGLAGVKLDADCVAALAASRPAIDEIVNRSQACYAG